MQHFQPHEPSLCSDLHEDSLPFRHSVEMTLAHASPLLISASFHTEQFDQSTNFMPHLTALIHFT